MEGGIEKNIDGRRQGESGEWMMMARLEWN